MVNYTICSKANSPIQANFSAFTVENNIIHIAAVGTLTKRVKVISAVAQYRHCNNDGQCELKTEFPLPNLCPIIAIKSVFGDAIGNYFQPPVRCPINAGSYKWKVTKQIKELSCFVQVKNCIDDRKCKPIAEFPLPNVCPVLSFKSIFGDAIGNYFNPPVKCPVSVRTYKYNFTMAIPPILLVAEIKEKTVFSVLANFFINKSTGKVTKRATLISATAQYKHCSNNGQCEVKMEIPLPNICPILSVKSVFGDAIGNYYDPPVRCPLNAGTYKFNFTINLKPIMNYLEMLQMNSTFINSKLLFISSIILILMMQSMCDANTQADVFQRHTRGKKLCGRALSETLSNVCALYNMEKKSGDDYDTFPYNEPMQQDWNQEVILPDYNSPFMRKIAAAAFTPTSFRRIRRGIHDECCRKPCSINELKSYCNRNGGYNDLNN
uniref:CSON000926 protein n=1 Tax=Culicoides sonorensis TaxID=179676 RepID=A0A336MJK3_CULSO